MSKYLAFALFTLAGLNLSCSTVQITRVAPGRGGELAIQEGIFGETAAVKAHRVMQGQCPDGYEIEEKLQVKVGSITSTRTETQAKVTGDKLGSSTQSVAETHDKTEKRLVWKCQGAASSAGLESKSPSTESGLIPVRLESELIVRQPTGWTADFGLGRRWYKPEDTAVANFHSSFADFRALYQLFPGIELGGSLHVDGYDNDTAAANENFTSSLFEFGLTARLSHRIGAFKPYILANSYVYGGGNREYERTLGLVSEKYVGRNFSRGVDAALGLAWSLGEGSLYFEWYRSAERTMTIQGRLERQIVYPNGTVATSTEGDRRSFKTLYDGFALGISLPIKD